MWSRCIRFLSNKRVNENGEHTIFGRTSPFMLLQKDLKLKIQISATKKTHYNLKYALRKYIKFSEL
jgi:hypothetical protein